MAKRAGWADQHTVGLYLKDETPPLEEDSADIITPREDISSNDRGMVTTSSSGDCHNEKGDDATDTTVAVSLAADFNDSSDEASLSETGDWTIVVRGTRYIGNARPGFNSSLLEATDAKDANAEFHVETTKEQNRRLLMKERTIQARGKKSRKTRRSRRPFCNVRTLIAVEEDVVVEGCSGATYVAEEDDSTNSDCLREVETVLGKKPRRSGNTKRVRRPHRKGIKVKGPSVRGVALECWRLTT